jgi:anti-sigma B factor antagonist
VEVQAEQVGDTWVVAPTGELDLASAPALGAELVRGGDGGRVVLDLRRLTFVDSSGIGLIVKLKRHFAVEGVRFGVVRGGEGVQRAFALSHVEGLMPWVDPPAAPPPPPP